MSTCSCRSTTAWWTACARSACGCRSSSTSSAQLLDVVAGRRRRSSITTAAIASANPAAERLLGRRRPDLQGRGLDELAGPLGRGAGVGCRRRARGRAAAGRAPRPVPVRRRSSSAGFPRRFYLIEELTEELRRTEKAAYEKLIRHDVARGEQLGRRHAVAARSRRSRTRAALPTPSAARIRAGAIGVATARLERLNTFMRELRRRRPACRSRACSPTDVERARRRMRRAAAAPRRDAARHHVASGAAGGARRGAPLDARADGAGRCINVLKNAVEAVGDRAAPSRCGWAGRDGPRRHRDRGLRAGHPGRGARAAVHAVLHDEAERPGHRPHHRAGDPPAARVRVRSPRRRRAGRPASGSCSARVDPPVLEATPSRRLGGRRRRAGRQSRKACGAPASGLRGIPEGQTTGRPARTRCRRRRPTRWWPRLVQRRPGRRRAGPHGGGVRRGPVARRRVNRGVISPSAPGNACAWPPTSRAGCR